MLINSVHAKNEINNIVTPVSYFTNHTKQLSLVSKYLKKYSNASIVGTSGLGKTQLARMYTYENKENYKLIWFIDCNLDLEKEFLKLAKAINVSQNKIVIEEITNKIEDRVREYLKLKKDWLLVFDNLKLSNQKIKKYLDWSHNGKVLFCSQNSTLLNHVVHLSSLEKKEAKHLAEQILENKDNYFVKFLSEEFDGYPILIVQGAQLINKIKGLDKKEYKKQLLNSADKIEYNLKLAINELPDSAKSLVNKMALINNSSFSKKLLFAITENKETLDSDIYQISKFLLISNTYLDQENPIFEMHDAIAEKIIKLNGIKQNKIALDKIISSVIEATPKSVIAGRIFRNSVTISENLEIILKNAEKYKVNIYRILELRCQLIIQYVNSSDYYNAAKQVNWFENNEKKSRFDIKSMSNDEKSKYAAYLELIGGYYKYNLFDYSKAYQYTIRAKAAYDFVKGYESFKNSTLFALSSLNMQLGRMDDAKSNIMEARNFIDNNKVSKVEEVLLYSAQAKLFLALGKYTSAQEQIDQTIKELIKEVKDPDDLIFRNVYITRTEILIALKQYQKAEEQIKQLCKMYNSSKKTNTLWARILTQMANVECKQGKKKLALKHVNEAIKIFSDVSGKTDMKEYKNPIVNPEIAKAYVIKGNILYQLNDLEQSGPV